MSQKHSKFNRVTDPELDIIYCFNLLSLSTFGKPLDVLVQAMNDQNHPDYEMAQIRKQEQVHT